MRRWLTQISPRRAAFGGLICLILGAVTTVGVAWGCAAWSNFYDREYFVPVLIRFNGSPVAVGVTAERGLGRQAVRVNEWFRTFEQVGDMVTWSDMRGSGPVGPAPVQETPVAAGLGELKRDRVVLAYESCGWPALALRCNTREVHVTNNDYASAVDRQAGAIQFAFWKNPPGKSLSYERQLPVRILPLGFLIDAFLYGVIWFGLIFGFGAARRKLRIRRGRCPMCAYNLRGDLDAGCPECGWNRNAAEEQGAFVMPA